MEAKKKTIRISTMQTVFPLSPSLSDRCPNQFSSDLSYEHRRYGNSFETFDQDADYQRSISFCILQIGELGSRLSQEFREATANRVQWGPIKGMRNLVAHSYGSMSRDIIWETAVTDIPVLKEFCEEQLSGH